LSSGLAHESGMVFQAITYVFNRVGAIELHEFQWGFQSPVYMWNVVALVNDSGNIKLYIFILLLLYAIYMQYLYLYLQYIIVILFSPMQKNRICP